VAKLDEFPFGPGLSILELQDPGSTPECKHGRLPLDPGAGCGCWPGWDVKQGPKPKPAEKPRRQGRHVRHPEHVKRRAVQLYREGHTSIEIGRRLGVSDGQVLVWVRAAGVVVRPRGARKAA
jgi:hypothetical protein